MVGKLLSDGNEGFFIFAVMKRKIYVPLLFILFFAACSKPAAPTFLRMEIDEVQNITKSQVYVKANAVFNNPNSVAGKLVRTDLKVVVNDVEVGTVQQDTTSVIPVNSDFKVPVSVNFPLKKVFSNKKGVLKGVLNALLDKKAKVRYEGTITIDFLKVNFDVPVDYEGELVIK